ncbi:YceD family protein [Paraurantiacibacter namhicola]|uniref:ACR n=1 Tax=Paraurantiacibacter namhicola TaxID=645517 RepID=A0A1C7D6U6_9SPHN|nr:DUF177 domain-containing protein [Paraurantiacibacter namhicola]ANU07184.1 hypothetical protein A6F65_00867 [Paraurantiacibacter namhicola]
MADNEFSHRIDPRAVDTRPVVLEADETERAALAKRFGLVSIGRLTATLALEADGQAVTAKGRMQADWIQPCSVSGEDLAQSADEELDLRFVPARAEPAAPDEVIELEEHELDEIEYEGQTFDLGEAVAQSLALAIDPYATGPDAERVRREKGLSDEASSGPFAALAALRKD